MDVWGRCCGASIDDERLVGRVPTVGGLKQEASQRYFDPLLSSANSIWQAIAVDDSVFRHSMHCYQDMLRMAERRWPALPD